MPVLSPGDTTQLDVDDDLLLPVDAWPVTQPDGTQWAQILADYNSESDTPWEIDERLDTVEREGTTYHDVSHLGLNMFVRVNAAPAPALFGITDVDPDAGRITVQRFPDDDADVLVPRAATTDTAPETLGETGTTQHAANDGSGGATTSSDSGTTTPISEPPSLDLPDDALVFPWNPDDDLPRSEWEIPANTEIGDLTISDIENGDITGMEGDSKADDDTPVIGYEVRYVTGSSLIVPYDELVDKCRDLGIPPQMVPDPLTEKRAFRRIFKENRLFGPGGEFSLIDEIVPNREIRYVVTRNGGSDYDRTIGVTEDIPEDEDDYDIDDLPEGGDVDYKKLGRVWFDDETNQLLLDRYDETKGTQYGTEWTTRIAPQIQHIYEENLTHLMGKDIRGSMVTPLLKQWTDSVRILNGVYFTPAVYGEKIDDLFAAFRELYGWFNEAHKDRGYRTFFEYEPIVNMQQLRAQYERHAEQKLFEMVDDFYDQLYDELAENDEFTEELVENVLAEQQDEIEAVADHYQQLVEGQLTVKQLLRDHFDRLSDRKQETIRQALADHDTYSDVDDLVV